MCRMIAAVGAFDVGALLHALESMASNSNPDYDHELRHKGSALVHDCGWGVAYLSGGKLVGKRSALSCLDDPEFGELAGLETNLLILHARRTQERDTIAEVNSHPFIASYRGEDWAFAHNGEIRDTAQLVRDRALAPAGVTDSELFFLHVLSSMDPEEPESSLGSIMSGMVDFTSLNCLLARRDSVLVGSRRAADSRRPLYYTMWLGTGESFAVVSSEVVGCVPCDTWEAVPDGATLRVFPPKRPMT